MKRRFTVLMTIMIIAGITACFGIFAQNKNESKENNNDAAYVMYETPTPIPLAIVDNERAERTFYEAGLTGATIKSMAATRTPTPTPTEPPVCVSITATYTGSELVVGDEVDKQDITVKAKFYNGSKYFTETVSGFEISDPYLYEVGENEIVVFYEGEEATIVVKAREELEIVSISAKYKGDSIIVSNAINLKDIEVYVNYNWTDRKSDKITNFTIEPEIVEDVGRNEIYVYYGELDPVTIYVTGIAKKVTGVTASYIGEPVYVGDYVSEDDIEVIVTYNDGSEDTVDDFKMTGDLINSTGTNYVVVTYKGYVNKIAVTGIEKDQTLQNIFKNYKTYADASSIVRLLISRNKRAESIDVSYVNWEEIDNCVNRVFNTDNYLGFEVTYTDPEAILEFPLYCCVTRPDDFPTENFGIYYSPNKKTIMARVVGEYIDDDEKQYVFIMEEPGTYIMVDEIDGKLVSSINVEETEITLKTNRNYSLNPTVLPQTATNREVTYYSSDESVATVSDKGKIKTLTPGECDIYIEAQDGSGVQEIVHITVTAK